MPTKTESPSLPAGQVPSGGWSAAMAVQGTAGSNPAPIAAEPPRSRPRRETPDAPDLSNSVAMFPLPGLRPAIARRRPLYLIRNRHHRIINALFPQYGLSRARRPGGARSALLRLPAVEQEKHQDDHTVDDAAPVFRHVHRHQHADQRDQADRAGDRADIVPAPAED